MKTLKICSIAIAYTYVIEEQKEDGKRSFSGEILLEPLFIQPYQLSPQLVEQLFKEAVLHAANRLHLNEGEFNVKRGDGSEAMEWPMKAG